jgi:hypothetical protein
MIGEPVTLHTRSSNSLNALGIEQSTYVDAVILGCAYDPGGSTELVQGQDIVVTQPTVYLPAGSTVGPIDQVTVRGTRYEVDGSPNDWRNPFTGVAVGVVVKLKAVTG